VLIYVEKTNHSDASISVTDTVTKDTDSVYYVRDLLVMNDALEVMILLSKFKIVTLKAKGDYIPNAVAIANIVTEKMLKGKTKIETIILDSEEIVGMGKVSSTIEINLLKI